MVQAGAGSRSLHRSGSGGVLIPGASPTRSSPDALRTPRTGSSARSSPGSSTRSHRHPSGGGGREASYDIYRRALTPLTHLFFNNTWHDATQLRLKNASFGTQCICAGLPLRYQ